MKSGWTLFTLLILVLPVAVAQVARDLPVPDVPIAVASLPNACTTPASSACSNSNVQLVVDELQNDAGSGRDASDFSSSPSLILKGHRTGTLMRGLDNVDYYRIVVRPPTAGAPCGGVSVTPMVNADVTLLVKKADGSWLAINSAGKGGSESYSYPAVPRASGMTALAGSTEDRVYGVQFNSASGSTSRPTGLIGEADYVQDPTCDPCC